MLQDAPFYYGVLTALSVLVVALLAVVVVLARSLRASRRTPARPKRTTAQTPEVAKASEPPDEENSAEVTRIAARVDVRDIPRLTEAQEDAAEPSGGPALEQSIARLLYDSEAEIGIDEPTGPVDLIVLSAVGQSDRGVTRRRNEDAYVVDTQRQLFAVADGMGGYVGGDVASRLAVRAIHEALESPTPEAPGYEDRPRQGRELIAAIERANETVFQQAQTTTALAGMGTTIVAASFAPRKQRIYVAHVGDSRCYRFRHGELSLLTTDHTLASRGVEGPFGQNLRRALGVAKTVKVDLLVDKPLPDDVFLLCSDGLPKMVTDEHIRRILSTHEGSLEQAAAQLVLAANASGGRDNITVVLVRTLEITKSTKKPARDKKTPRVQFGPL